MEDNVNFLSLEKTEILELLNKFKESVTNYSNNISKLLSLFENQEIVQSFFKSGQFGQEQMNRIQEIYENLKKYNEELFYKDNSIIVKTENYLSANTSIDGGI